MCRQNPGIYIYIYTVVPEWYLNYSKFFTLLTKAVFDQTKRERPIALQRRLSKFNTIPLGVNAIRYIEVKATSCD